MLRTDRDVSLGQMALRIVHECSTRW